MKSQVLCAVGLSLSAWFGHAAAQETATNPFEELQNAQGQVLSAVAATAGGLTMEDLKTALTGVETLINGGNTSMVSASQPIQSELARQIALLKKVRTDLFDTSGKSVENLFDEEFGAGATSAPKVDPGFLNQLIETYETLLTQVGLLVNRSALAQGPIAVYKGQSEPSSDARAAVEEAAQRVPKTREDLSKTLGSLRKLTGMESGR